MTIHNFKKQEIYQKALGKWGIAAQIDVAIEEMAELSFEILENQEGKNKNHEEIREEIADTIIMIEQLKIYFAPDKVFELDDSTFNKNTSNELLKMIAKMTKLLIKYKRGFPVEKDVVDNLYSLWRLTKIYAKMWDASKIDNYIEYKLGRVLEFLAEE
ncbi:MAG: hypothetical protein ACOCQR_02535 [bacterium]